MLEEESFQSFQQYYLEREIHNYIIFIQNLSIFLTDLKMSNFLEKRLIGKLK